MRIKATLTGLVIAAIFSLNTGATGNLANIEAMFLYNFLRHINWPEGNNNENFVIGIYGTSDIHTQLIQFTNNRKVGTRSIEVRKISTLAETVACQMIFVPANQISSIPSIKNQLGNRACLIVGEKEGSNAQGSAIEFILKDNSLKFKVDEQKAKQHNLVVSRALLDMSL